MSHKDLIKEMEITDLRDDPAFPRLIKKFFEVTNFEIKILANRFAVSKSTIERWSNGVTSPHPAMRRPVYDACIKLMKEHFKED